MKKVTSLILLALCISTCILVHAQKITVTIAGNGMHGFSGDGGPGKMAQISNPNDVCMDAAENIYFVDKGNNRIRKVSATNGIITTIAGGGTSTADGVPATNAMISPSYMCINSSGLYISTGNMIRKINLSTGNITTIAGTGTSGFSGDGGPAIAATLDDPQGICLDGAGNLYVVDRNNHRIRKIDASSSVITTVCGTGSIGFAGDGGPASAATLNYPGVICANSAGDLFFSDQSPSFPMGYDNSRVRKISAGTGIISTFAGSPTGSFTHSVPALNAILGTITGVCFDAAGNFFCNEMSCSCRMMRPGNDTLFLVGGNFYIQGYSDDMASPLANMDHPNGLCADSHGAVYIADNMNDRIRKVVTLTNTPTFVYGGAQTISATAGVPYPLSTTLAITDIDSPQVEAWTIVTPPSHGSTAGFMLAEWSMGKNHTTMPPTGGTYTAYPGYTGPDMFRVRATDATLSDTITIYVNVAAGSGGGTTQTNNLNNTASDIAIFPNPSTSTINIAWSKQVGNDNYIVIKDITDRIVYSQHAGGADNIQVDISMLVPGVYITTLNGTIAGKFVKR